LNQSEQIDSKIIENNLGKTYAIVKKQLNPIE